MQSVWLFGQNALGSIAPTRRKRYRTRVYCHSRCDFYLQVNGPFKQEDYALMKIRGGRVRLVCVAAESSQAFADSAYLCCLYKGVPGLSPAHLQRLSQQLVCSPLHDVESVDRAGTL